MPNVISRTGGELNSAYQISDIQGFPGLILESWGPSLRNPDYNDALEVIIERLQRMGVCQIGVNVISRELLVLLPEFAAREISVDGFSGVSLQGRSANEIRLDVGRAQARLKNDPSTSGGNRTKRILLHSPLLDSDHWHKVAAPEYFAPQNNLREELPVPMGKESPKSTTQLIVVIQRDASVRAWVLQSAGGFCDLCRQPAPFLDFDGVPFLEVHHVVPLAGGGSDKTTNAVALCPNCHRELHHGASREAKIERLYANVSRLVRV